MKALENITVWLFKLIIWLIVWSFIITALYWAVWLFMGAIKGICKLFTY